MYLISVESYSIKKESENFPFKIIISIRLNKIYYQLFFPVTNKTIPATKTTPPT